LATGARLFVLIMVFGPISCAHFNPAVSLVAAVRGKLLRAHLPLYVLAQLGRAIINVGFIGVWIAHAMFGLDLLQTSAKTRTGASQWCAEFVATFGLLLTTLGSALTKDQPLALVAAMVGLYIIAAYWFTAPTSFANPAVRIARSLTDTFTGIRPADISGFIAATSAPAHWWPCWLPKRSSKN